MGMIHFLVFAIATMFHSQDTKLYIIHTKHTITHEKHALADALVCVSVQCAVSFGREKETLVEINEHTKVFVLP